MDEYIFHVQCNVLPQVKIWHWQTMEHAAHVALDGLYESIIDAIDKVAESWQGRTSTRISVKGEQRAEIVDFSSADQAIEMLNGLVEATMTQIETLKKLDTFGDIINLLEELNGILGKSMYLLTLK